MRLNNRRNGEYFSKRSHLSIQALTTLSGIANIRLVQTIPL
ncbi:hypothetical protein HMPREF3212_03085 [Citrobacter freundii]|nr:hypothetical protein HMPREF3212_03085 [Citrobacter freundii]